MLVTEVAPDGPAEAKGLQAGDVILSVDRKPVTEPADVVAGGPQGARERRQVGAALLSSRDGNERFEAVPLATS